MSTPNPVAVASDPAPAAPPPANPPPAAPPATALPAGGVVAPVATAAPTPDESPLGLTGDMAADTRLSKFQNVEALAQSYLQMESNAGNSIRVPGEDATAEMRQDYLTKLQKHAPELMVKPDSANTEQMDDFYQTLGRPEDSSGYTIPEVKTPDGENADMSSVEGLRDIAFGVGLTDAQFSGLVEGVTNGNIAAGQHQLTEWGKTIQVLRDEWGQAYGDRYRAASDIAIRTGAPEDVLSLMRNGYAAPDTIKWLYNLSKQFGSEGGQLVTQDPGGLPQTGLSPDEAQAQLSEMMNNKQHALWQPHHPEHGAAVTKRLELQKAINPGASTNINDLRASPIREFDS